MYTDIRITLKSAQTRFIENSSFSLKCSILFRVRELKRRISTTAYLPAFLNFTIRLEMFPETAPLLFFSHPADPV